MATPNLNATREADARTPAVRAWPPRMRAAAAVTLDVDREAAEHREHRRK
jgi:hypothetical protein